MEMSNEQNRQSQGGSGSAENRGGERTEQLNPNNTLTDQEKNRIQDAIGSEKVPVAGREDLGVLSGRDDAAGTPGDGMENQQTGENTERYDTPEA